MRHETEFPCRDNAVARRSFLQAVTLDRDRDYVYPGVANPMCGSAAMGLLLLPLRLLGTQTQSWKIRAGSGSGFLPGSHHGRAAPSERWSNAWKSRPNRLARQARRAKSLDGIGHRR